METSAAPVFTDAWQPPLLLRLLLQEPSPSFATTQQKQETLWTQGNKLVMDCPLSCILTTCKKWLSRNLNRCWTCHTWFCLIGYRIDHWNESSPLLQQVQRVNALSTLKGNQNHAVIHFALLSTENRADVCQQSSWERQQHGQAKGRQVSCSQILGSSRHCWMLET